MFFFADILLNCDRIHTRRDYFIPYRPTEPPNFSPCLPDCFGTNVGQSLMQLRLRIIYCSQRISLKFPFLFQRRFLHLQHLYLPLITRFERPQYASLPFFGGGFKSPILSCRHKQEQRSPFPPGRREIRIPHRPCMCSKLTVLVHRAAPLYFTLLCRVPP